MKWILSLVFVLMFGFCAEAQKYDSVTANIIPVFKGSWLEIKDTSKPIFSKLTGKGTETISIINKKDYLTKFYTGVIYNSDSVIYIAKNNSFILMPQFRKTFENLKEGETIEFLDIYYFAGYSPPAYRLNKKLRITKKDGKIINEILPDFSDKKIDNLGRPHLKWVTNIETSKGEMFRVETIYANGKEYGSKTYIKGKIYKQKTPINDSIFYQKTYFINGKTQSELNFLNGDTFGLFSTFYENGKLKIGGQYILQKDQIETKQFGVDPWDPYNTYDSTVWTYKSVKDKTWLYYDKKGKLIRKEIYEQGKLIRKEDY